MKEIRVQHTAKISSSREGDVWIIQSLEVRMLDHSGQATGCPGSTCSTWGGWPGATKPRAQPPNRSIHRRYQSALVSVKHSVILRSEAKQIQYYYIRALWDFECLDFEKEILQYKGTFQAAMILPSTTTISASTSSTATGWVRVTSAKTMANVWRIQKNWKEPTNSLKSRNSKSEWEKKAQG